MFVFSKVVAAATAVAATMVHDAQACTMIICGKNATVDGSTMVAHTDDAGGGASDVRLVRVPAMDHAPGSMRAVYDENAGYPRLAVKDRGDYYKPVDGQNETGVLGYVPEVEHTYGYFDHDYGMMNEHQLAIGESTCSAKTVGWPSSKKGYGYNMFGIAELTKLALERCDSARCAVKTMGDHAVKYGFFSEDSGSPEKPLYADTAESVGITDKYGEAWIFHVLTGKNNASAIWAAQRVPDTDVATIANGFIIREMDLDDKDNFMASPDVTALAEEMGWWNPKDGDFDFTAAYAFADPGPIYPLYVGRRVWRVFDVLAPSLKLDSTLGFITDAETYPFSVTPDNKVSAKDLMNLLQDHYEGTEYDMTQGIAAGPYNSPIRYDGPNHGVDGGWERPIAMFRTLFSFVCVSNGNLPDALGGVTYYGPASSHGTVYMPLSCAQKSVPESFAKGEESKFSTDSAWWAFSFVNNWSYLRYRVIAKDVKAEQARLQERAFDNVKMIAKHGQSMNDTNAMLQYVEKAHNDFATDVVNDWWKLAWNLIGKFADGYITEGEGSGQMQNEGYPKWWLDATSYAAWPGKTFNPPAKGADKAMHFPDGESVVPKEEAAPAPSRFSWSLILNVVLVVAVLGLLWKMQSMRRAGYQRL